MGFCVSRSSARVHFTIHTMEIENLYAFVARAGVKKNKWYEEGTSLEANYGNTESECT